MENRECAIAVVLRPTIRLLCETRMLGGIALFNHDLRVHREIRVVREELARNSRLLHVTCYDEEHRVIKTTGKAKILGFRFVHLSLYFNRFASEINGEKLFYV